MGLRDCRVSAQIAVSDMARAAEFYGGRLGLPAAGDQPGGGLAYLCGGGTVLHVYLAPAHAGKATATVARWDVDDLERVVGELTANGVVFESYDDPVRTDAKGIHDSGYGRVAWFKDPDGNTFALEQV
jgi:catechol 2,3-dioxygenase-like lactoylglutathione lyase family enzyme